MISLNFIIKRAKNTNFNNWIDTAKKIGRETHKNWISVLADMVNCTVKHGAGYVDYDTLCMYRMSEAERANVMTIGRNSAFVKELNDPEKRKIFSNKVVFNKVFHEYVKRDWILLDGKNFNDFVVFVSKHSKLVAKPIDLSCGTGIQVIEINETSDIKSIYNSLMNDGTHLVEEAIVQDEEMAKLCSTSVNTIRMVTVRNGNDVTLLMSCVRMGREGNYVDNFNYGGYGAKKGGFAANLDSKTGKVLAPAFDKSRETYEVLPVVGTNIMEFQIPKWDECVAFVKKAAMVVPEVRFVGWDLCISKDRGLLLIEGNEFPGNDLQLPNLDIGTYGAMMRALGREKN